MVRLASGSMVRQLEALFDGGSLAGLSDRELLERYSAGGRGEAGEAAFAALLRRHGPMVLGVCRQLLGDLQHAEDAFQAVFVVLVEKLKISLVRRGVALPAAALGAILSPRAASASIPLLLCDSTTRAAIAFAVRHTASGGALAVPAAALAQEVLRTMFLHKLRLTAMSVLRMAAVATCAGWLGHSLAIMDDPKKNLTNPLARAAPPDSDRAGPATKPDPAEPARMTVVGRVLGPDGKPVAGAVVDLVARPRSPWVGASEELDHHTLLGTGQSDGDGRFRLDSPRTASTRVFEVTAIAAAPGSGLGWARLNADAEQPAGELHLRPEQVIRGRLVDVNGQPATGVELRIQSIGLPNDLGKHDGIMFWDESSEVLRAWPRPVKTDDQGLFAIAGIGRGLDVRLEVRDLRFARQLLGFETHDQEPAKLVTRALEPATILEGRALAADTRLPISNAVIAVGATRAGTGITMTKFRADNQGRFTANPFPGDQFHLNAFALAGQPYLVPQVEFAWTKGAVKKVIDIKLPRGTSIRGKVIEQGTGRSLAGASVQYTAIDHPDHVKGGWEATVASKDDGSFEIVVPPGKGHLLIFGPTSDYVLEVIGDQMLYRGQPGGTRNYAHKILDYEVKAGDQPHEIDAILRPGKTIKGRVVGPQGQAIEDAAICR